MSPDMPTRVVIFLSMIYGVTVAILGMTGNDNVGLFAAIGGMVIGLIWVAKAFFYNPKS